MRGLQGRVWGAGGLAEKVLIQGARTCGVPPPQEALTSYQASPPPSLVSQESPTPSEGSVTSSH